MRRVFVVLAACGGAASTPPVVEPKPEPPPYARLFEENARWELPAYVTVQSSADKPPSVLAGTTWALVSKVTVYGDARVAWLEIGTGGDIKSVVSALPRNELIETPKGMWTTGTEADHAVTRRADIDELVVANEIRMAAKPVHRQLVLPERQRGEGLLDERIEEFEHAGSWCMRHRQAKKGEVADSTVCFNAKDGITGGDASSWRPNGFVATLRFGDDPADTPPTEIPQ